MEKWKKILLQMIICIGLVCLIWSGFFLVRYGVIDKALVVQEDDFSWVFQVDSVEMGETELLLQGFAFELNKDAAEGAFKIVLQDVESQKHYFLNMEYTERDDVNSHFLCDKDYLQSGFIASMEKKELNLKEKTYEVLLKVADRRITYRTGTFLSDGRLVYANPAGFEPLYVEGTDLESVVKEGVLRVYRPEFGMYVYQYDGKLYWIAENDYKFEAGGVTFLEFQLNTTQPTRLPMERIKAGWKWDNRRFYFENKELTNKELGEYRVAVTELPIEYSITDIQVGYYVNDQGWIWSQKFHPVFELGN